MRCREIGEQDLVGVTDLLTRGFNRRRRYWECALGRLQRREAAQGLPRYGYLLEDQGRVVGVLLVIATRVHAANRCNVSSWYVDPDYRAYGALLPQRVMRYPDTTYFNVSPAPHTWPILEQQGFERFANGRMIVSPWLMRPTAGALIRRFSTTIDKGHPDFTLLRDHADFGCLSLICEYAGEHYPFVFGRQLRWGFLPIAHLVYCRDIAFFVRFAGSLGFYLARRAYAGIIMDADGPMRGLAGRYFGGRPRFRKGGNAVRLGDVAYSEQILFGY